MATGRLPDPNTAPLTAKGDLYTYSTVPARLAVGSNGDTLVADSSATTGLRWQGDYAAGKNKIINGDFRLNQRAFSSTTTDGTYGFDRWRLSSSDGTSTYSAQTFTLGAAPVSGYEGINFARLISTGQTSTTALTALQQRIESVRTFAGQTVTVSLWAKASTGTPNITIWGRQVFGTGGSPSTSVEIGTTKQAITSSWARYSFQLTIPSISGKTLGTAGDDALAIILVTSAGTDRNVYTDSLGIQSVTIDFWGVQVEAGNVATAFQTATGTLAGELSLAQRYYWRSTPSSAYGFFSTGGGAYSTTQAEIYVANPVPMRIIPTTLEYSTLEINIPGTSNTAVTGLTISALESSQYMMKLDATVASGLTASRVAGLRQGGSSSAYLGFSAEL